MKFKLKFNLIFVFLLIILYDFSVSKTKTGNILGRIIADKVNIRETPSLSGRVLAQISIDSLVYIEKVDDKEIIIDGKKGRWAYLTKGGWVFDYYILYEEKEIGSSGFEKVTDLKLATNKVTIKGSSIGCMENYSALPGRTKLTSEHLSMTNEIRLSIFLNP
jgi:hypothetical protein